MDFVVVAIDLDLHRDAASPGVAIRDHECDILPSREGGARGGGVGVNCR